MLSNKLAEAVAYAPVLAHKFRSVWLYGSYGRMRIDKNGVTIPYPADVQYHSSFQGSGRYT